MEIRNPEGRRPRSKIGSASGGDGKALFGHCQVPPLRQTQQLLLGMDSRLGLVLELPWGMLSHRPHLFSVALIT